MSLATLPSAPTYELWMPTRYVKSLSGTEDFPTHADWLLKLVDLVWITPDGKPLHLDDWQRWLLRHMLEVCPPGHPRAGDLRFRRAVVSMARQNGKSVLGAILALYGLVRESGALVIGIASSSEQARIIYSRLLLVLNSNPKLAKRFKKMTETRGISSNSGSRYELKASKSASVQGLDLSLGLADELHIMKKELWSDLINGSASKRNGLVVGITTAGDDSSALLIDLYREMDSDHDERFFYAVWEAPEAEVPEDDALLREYLIAANPAIASGRMDLDTIVSDVRGMPKPDVIRYRLNRFVSSSNSFIQLHQWMLCHVESLSKPSYPIFTIDRDPNWNHASIVATWKSGDVTHTQIVASVAKPTIGKLTDLCVMLSEHEPRAYVADNYTLGGLIAELKKRGLPVRAATLKDVTSGASMFYAKVVRKEIGHLAEPLMTNQIPSAVRKNVSGGDGFRISRANSGVEIDTVIATMMGVYFAELLTDETLQLF